MTANPNVIFLLPVVQIIIYPIFLTIYLRSFGSLILLVPLDHGVLILSNTWESLSMKVLAGHLPFPCVQKQLKD